MRIAGVEVSDSAAAQLALLLHRAGQTTLAMQIGFSVDHLRDEAHVIAYDFPVILAALENCPDCLSELRTALLDEKVGRKRRAGVGGQRPHRSGRLGVYRHALRDTQPSAAPAFGDDLDSLTWGEENADGHRARHPEP